MKNRNSRFFFLTLCAAALVHAGALALVPGISREPEEKPVKSPVQIALSFPPEAPPQLPLPPVPKQAETEKPPPPVPEPEPPAETPSPPDPDPADPGPVENGIAEEAENQRDFAAEPAALTGTASGKTPEAPDPNVRANLLQQYQAIIRRQIDGQKEYPYQARRQDQEGTVEICFVLTRQGQLMEEPVLGKKTRYRLLNNAALEAVKKAVPYPPFPPEFPEEKLAFSITLAFSLTGNTF